MTRIVLTLAVALTLIACEQPKKAPAPEAEAEAGAEVDTSTGLPGSLDPKARMDEVKKDYKKALKTGADNRNKGIERSLGEGGEE